MATYTAVVTLMQDLEQTLTSYDRIFRLSDQRLCPFTKKEIEILYNTVSLMDSLLRDSSGLCYNHEFMNPTLEKRIRDAAHKSGNYIDFWAMEYDPVLTDQAEIITGSPILLEITKELFSITEELKTIHDVRKLQDLEVTNSTDNRSEERKRDHIATCNAVVSLREDLKQQLSSYDPIFRMGFYPHLKQDIEFLCNSVSWMDSFLRDSSGQSYKFMQRIQDVVHEARDYVDFLLQCLPPQNNCCWRRTILEDPTLTKITEEIVSINEELQKIHDNKKLQDLEIGSSTGKSSIFLSPLRTTPNTEGKLVGIEKDLVTMLDNLTGHPSQLKVFPIIGMGGIGKTTFSRKLYENPFVVHHFYVRIWVTVLQQYQVREMLLGILHCAASVSNENYGRSNEELRENVYRTLKGKRYLIVLDDMWDTKAWDELKRTFPDDKNGSRIILTSRLRDVAVHASQGTPPHCLSCLSIHESWELLRSKIFAYESCPLELVDIGKQIAYKCQGLPLALVVIGGLLSNTYKKLDVWKEVAQSASSLVMGEGEHCQNILALSYNHLPDHLKPCFLYMGIFPEDYEISVKKLMWLWIAEGFIRPSTLKSLEELAEDYLEDLATRSLILVKRRGPDGRIKTCYIHDIMRELCLRESQKQNFLHVINSCGQLPLTNQVGHPLPNIDVRRLSFHTSIRKYIHKTSVPYTRSFMCFEKLSLSDPRGKFGMHFGLLKILDIMNIHLSKIPREIMYLTLLKFMGLTTQDSAGVKNLFRFLSLQTLILDCEWDGHLPRIFWDMLELRHFHLKRSCLAYSSVSEPVDAQLPLRILNNLRSVSTVRPVSCTEKIFISMPYLKKLGIYETEEDYRFRGWFKKLVCLRELETLKYVFSNPFVSSVFKSDRLPSWHKFPPKLVKLTLSGTSLPWDDMSKLSMLPKLEVLKLRNYAFSGTVWTSKEGGFHCLKFLLIGSTNLEIWETDGSHFPKLQHLVLRHCRFLKDIPYGIGEAPLLETIELHRCKDSAVMSARHLQEEQQSLGNDGLTVYITEI